MKGSDNTNIIDCIIILHTILQEIQIKSTSELEEMENLIKTLKENQIQVFIQTVFGQLIYYYR